MRSLSNLSPDELKAARDAAATLMRFKVFLPRGTLLLMLISRLGDDARAALGTEPEQIPARQGVPERGRWHGFRPLDEMTTTELAAVSGAVSTLLEPRLTANMDDPALPELLSKFNDALTEQKTERDQLRAQVAS